MKKLIAASMIYLAFVPFSTSQAALLYNFLTDASTVVGSVEFSASSPGTIVDLDLNLDAVLTGLGTYTEGDVVSAAWNIDAAMLLNGFVLELAPISGSTANTVLTFADPASSGLLSGTFSVCDGDSKCNSSLFNQVRNTSFRVEASRVPVPATFALMGLGLAGIGYHRRQSKAA